MMNTKNSLLAGSSRSGVALCPAAALMVLMLIAGPLILTCAQANAAGGQLIVRFTVLPAQELESDVKPLTIPGGFGETVLEFPGALKATVKSNIPWRLEAGFLGDVLGRPGVLIQWRESGSGGWESLDGDMSCTLASGDKPGVYRVSFDIRIVVREPLPPGSYEIMPVLNLSRA